MLIRSYFFIFYSIALTFVGPIATYDSTAGLLVAPENAAVNTGAPPGSASRPSVISPTSTIGGTVPALSGLISSWTRHSIAAAAGTPRPTAGYRFGRRPQPVLRRRSTSTHSAPTPPAGVQSKPSPKTTPSATAPASPEPLAPTNPTPTPSTTSYPLAPTPPSPPPPEPIVEPDDDLYLLACFEHYNY